MVDQKIVSFIQDALKKGNSRGDIEKVLVQKGWSAQQIQEAFAVSDNSVKSSGSSPVNTAKPIATTRTFLIVIGAVILLIVLGVAYMFLVPSESDVSNDECSSDRDCLRGEACEDGNCVMQAIEEEEEELEEDEELVIEEEEEAECEEDEDCDDGFACSTSGSCYDSCTLTSGCADGYECDDGECTKVDSDKIVDYKINSIDFDTLSFSPIDIVSSLSYRVNISNDGNSNASGIFSVACGFAFENGSSIGINYYKFSANDFIGLESSIYNCYGNSTSLYYTVQSLGIVNVSMNVIVDYYDNVSESYENNNDYMFNHSVAFGNYSVTGSTVCSSGGSECTGYDCAQNNYCYNVCTEFGGECADGYSCSGGSCQASSSSSANVSSGCSSNSNCGTGYLCDSSSSITSGTCVECLSTDLSNCASGYACVTDETSSLFHTCYDSCTDSANCASGYTCSSGSCVVESGSSTGGTDSTASTSDDCSEVLPSCADGVDNDGDGLVDLEDSCESWEDKELAEESTTDDSGSSTECNDGTDNDDDGDIDYGLDTGCGSESDESEGLVWGYTDSCSSDSDCSEDGYSCDTSIGKCGTSCSNREDDNNDGVMDYYGACSFDYDDTTYYYSCSQVGIDPNDYSSADSYREACFEECEPQMNIFGTEVETVYINYDPECSGPYGDEGCEEDSDCLSDEFCNNAGLCITSTCSDGKDNDVDGNIDYSGAIELKIFNGDIGEHVSTENYTDEMFDWWGPYSCDGDFEASIWMIFVLSNVEDKGLLYNSLSGKSCEEQCESIDESYGDEYNDYRYNIGCDYYEADESCEDASDTEATCSDAEDNEGDGYYDYYGACEFTDNITTCVDIVFNSLSSNFDDSSSRYFAYCGNGLNDKTCFDYIESNSPGGIGIGSFCSISCTGRGGTYLEADDGCNKLTDNSEKIITAASSAPEEGKSLLEKIFDFFFVGDGAGDAFLDVSYIRKK